jgi:ethanolamine transporter EutH
MTGTVDMDSISAKMMVPMMVNCLPYDIAYTIYKSMSAQEHYMTIQLAVAVELAVVEHNVGYEDHH